MLGLETNRLVGRPPRDDRDFGALRLIHADPRATATLSVDGRPFAERETRDWLGAFAQHHARHGFAPWFWYERYSGDFVGYCGLKHSRFEGVPMVELMYGLRMIHWRRGYAAEAARASLVDGFGRLGLEEIVCVALPRNLGSRAVMAGQGFVFERPARHKGLLVLLSRLRRADWERAATPPARRN